MFPHLPFDCVLRLLLLLLLLPGLTRSLERSYIVEVGQDASLPCSYAPSTPGTLVPVCWGRQSCPLFGCGDLLLSIDERKMVVQKSRRYQLQGNFHTGDVSLTIVNVTLADSGTYCCRVQFPGLMNDGKFNLKLVIIQAKVVTPPTTQRDFTTAFPRIPTTEGRGSETETLRTLHDKNQTQISTLANEFQDSGATTRTGVYAGAGISAGLALMLICGAAIHMFFISKKKISHGEFSLPQLSPKLLSEFRPASLARAAPGCCLLSKARPLAGFVAARELPVSTASLPFRSLIALDGPRPSGLANALAEGVRAEENVYEMEDPDEDYCYASNGPPP
ncbi:hepatitis A virus cellular receptor 2 homolog [Ctenodactylus gundi]